MADSEEFTRATNALLVSRKFEEAVQACRKQLLKTPDSVQVRGMLGRSLLALGQYSEVVSELGRWVRPTPEHKELLALLGEAWLSLGDRAEAEKSLQIAAEFSEPGAKRILNELNRATSTATQGSDNPGPAHSGARAAADVAPKSGTKNPDTIERWFGDIAEKTVQAKLDADGNLVDRSSPGKAAPTAAAPATSAPGISEPVKPQAKSSSPGTVSLPDTRGMAAPPPKMSLPSIGPVPSTSSSRSPLLSPVKLTLDAKPAALTGGLAVPVTLPLGTGPVMTGGLKPPIAQKDGGFAAEPKPLLGLPKSLDPGFGQSVEEGKRGFPAAPPPSAFPSPTKASATEPDIDELDLLDAVSLPNIRLPKGGAGADMEDEATNVRDLGEYEDVSGSLGFGQIHTFSDEAPTAIHRGGESPPRNELADHEGTNVVIPSTKKTPKKSAVVAKLPKSPKEPSRLRVWWSNRLYDFKAGLTFRNSLKVLGVLTALGGVVFGVYWYLRTKDEGEVRAQLDAMLFDGRSVTLDRAASLLDSAGVDSIPRRSLRARIYAHAAVEYADAAAIVQAETLLAQNGTQDRTGEDTVVSRALLAVAKGHPDEALPLLQSLHSSGLHAAEGLRVRAMATWMLGRMDEAIVASRDALMLVPASPRHATLAARILSSTGDNAGALEILERIPNAIAAPDIRATRALIAMETEDWAAAESEARALLSEFQTVAASWETGIAHLVIARTAIRRGELPRARHEAEDAAQRRPVYDETYASLAIRALLDVSATELASRIMARLPRAGARNPRRAILMAEMALVRGDVTAAASALEAAPNGPRVELMRGQISEAQGQFTEARNHYTRAAQDPIVSVEANRRLGGLLLAEGHPAEARTALENAVRSAPNDIATLGVLIETLVSLGELDDAERRLAAALASNPESTELIPVRASLLLGRQRYDEAYTVLLTAVEASPDSRSLQLSLGRAAQMSNHLPEARRAFERAVTLGAREANMGLIQLDLMEGNLAEAERRVTELGADAPADSPEVIRVRAALAVARGAGAEGLVPIRAYYQAHPEDREVTLAVARLATQAEDVRTAQEALRRVLAVDANNVEALLTQAQLEIVRQSFGDASGTLTRLSRITSLSPAAQARIEAMRGRLRFESVGDLRGARERAQAALRLDARCADAHLLLAILAGDAREDPLRYLRAAATAFAPTSEIFGWLAVRARGDESCRAARHYQTMAPTGGNTLEYQRSEVTAAIRRCS